MIQIKVPSVGESITSGVLGAWKIKDGGYVKEGDAILEIETEKVTSEIFAEKSGSVKHLIAEGTEVKIGQVIGELDETATAPAKAEPKTAANSEAIPLSPAVRKAVEEQNIDPSLIKGSGKGGRILKEDLAKIQAPEVAPARVPSGPAQEHRPVVPATVSVQSSANNERVTRKKMSPLRKKIAERLVAAQQEAAMLTTFNEVDLSNVIELRKKHQDRFVAKHGVKLGFMSFFVKAAVSALKQVPAVNARIDGEEIVENHFHDIGIAISTDKGLLVPVLRDADQLNLAQIEQAIISYSKKARDGKITLPDLEGGVFTITNGGVFGPMLSTPILNPPQSAIIGMHAIIERPVAISGQVVIRPMMYLALSYDHRLVDGKQAVTFLVRIKEYIENPGVALLDL